MKMFNFRTKVRVAGAVLVVCMFLVAGISGVFANTVTITDLAISDNSGLLINFTDDSSQFTRVSIGGVNITDNGISDNTYGERINFTDDWFNFTNGFFGGVRKINSSYDNKATFITNSNGGVWSATDSKLQEAIWDLNSTGGTVWNPGVSLSGIVKPYNVTVIDTISSYVWGAIGMNISDGGLVDIDTNLSLLHKGYAYIIVNTTLGASCINGTNGDVEYSSADETAVIQYALDRMNAESLYISRGKYFISSPLVINGYSITVIGSSAYSGSNGLTPNTGLYLADNSNCDMIQINGRCCTIKNLFLYGNKDNNAGGNGIVINTAGMSQVDCRIKNCYLFKMDESGINISNGVYCVGLNDVIVEYCDGPGFYFGGENRYLDLYDCSSVSNNYGFNFRNDSEFNTMIGCHSYDSVRSSLYIHYNCSHNVFKGNEFRNSGETGIYTRGISNNSIEGNIIHNAGLNVDDTYTGIFLGSDSGYESVKNIVTGNIISGDESNKIKYGIREDGSSPDYNVITDNIINGAQTVSILKSGINTICKDNIGYNNNSLFPFYEQDTAPSVADNCTVYWYDTDDDYMYQVVNSYGSVWYVNMTKTI